MRIMGNNNPGLWEDWVKRCPSLIHGTHLQCLATNIEHLSGTLTKLESLEMRYVETYAATINSAFKLPPNLHTLKLNFSSPTGKAWLNSKFSFPPRLKHLELIITGVDIQHADDDILSAWPIDRLLAPLSGLTHLEMLTIPVCIVGMPVGEFPNLAKWPNLHSLSARVTKPEVVHRILASVPSTQWRSLTIECDELDPNKPGLFEGMEEADWSQLEFLAMNERDFFIDAAILKRFTGLRALHVYFIHMSPFWTTLLTVIAPETHPHLGELDHFSKVQPWTSSNMSKEVMEALLTWPHLISFPGSNQFPQPKWNRIRQSSLEDLAAHPLSIRTLS